MWERTYRIQGLRAEGALRLSRSARTLERVMDQEREELEEVIEEKLDHFCYEDCYYRWVTGTQNEMYLHYPSSGSCTKVLSDSDLPIPWYISNIWVKTKETTISIKR
jgi:branched-subunit amino acid aminotransferase/4-amino-4-deoxychorismate lyase